MTIYHAFYSRKQESIIAAAHAHGLGSGGTVSVYRLVDGREEVCTELKMTKDGHGFSDSVYLGEVEVPGNFLKSVAARIKEDVNAT